MSTPTDKSTDKPTDSQPAAATPEADSSAKPVRQLTDAELDAQQDQFMARMFGDRKPKAKAKKQEDPAPTPDDKSAGASDDQAPPDPDADAGAPDPAKPAQTDKPDNKAPKTDAKGDKPDDQAPEPPKPAVDLPPDLDEFRSQMARSAAPAVDDGTPTEDDLAKLPKRHREHLAVLKRMAKDNPEEYAGLDRQFVKFLKREAEYIQGWLQANPKSRFDPSSDEHQEFYAAHNVTYDEFDYRSAVRAEIVEEARREAKAESRRESERTQRESAVREADRAAEAVGYYATTAFMAMADPEVAGKHLVKTDRGYILNEEAVAKMKAEDPIALRTLIRESAYMAALVKECARFEGADGRYSPPDTRTVEVNGIDFPVVKALGKFAADHERAMLRLDPRETMREGRRLISSLQMSEAVSEIQSDKRRSKDQKERDIDRLTSKYYALEMSDFRAALVRAYAAKAAEEIKELRAHYKTGAPTGTSGNAGDPAAKDGKTQSSKAAASKAGLPSSSDFSESRVGQQDKPPSEEAISSSRAFRVRA